MGISTKFTHADLLAMPEDGKRREIVDGELFVSPSPRATHQMVVMNLMAAIAFYLQAHPIGKVLPAPLDVILSDLDVLEPDLLFVLNEHRFILQDWVRGVPDLVIEVLSPSTAAIDRGPKLKAYARFGVPEYWIVDPDARTIELYQLTTEAYEPPHIFRGHETLTSTLLPRLVLPINTIFEQD